MSDAREIFQSRSSKVNSYPWRIPKSQSFQVAQLAYDVTVRFCNRYIGKQTRTHDQMVQAARSGVENIAEGSMASATSKKTELKLTNVARASLEELRLDYEDFLRQRGLTLWTTDDSRRAALVARRPKSADEVARWAMDVRIGNGQIGQHGLSGRDPARTAKSDAPSTKSTMSTASTYAEISANGALTLIAVASSLLARQITTLERSFLEEGGFTEKLYRARTAARSSVKGNRKGGQTTN